MRKVLKAIRDWRSRRDAQEIARLKHELKVQRELAERAEHLALTAIEGYLQAVKEIDEFRELLNPKNSPAS